MTIFFLLPPTIPSPRGAGGETPCEGRRGLLDGVSSPISILVYLGLQIVVSYVTSLLVLTVPGVYRLNDCLDKFDN